MVTLTRILRSARGDGRRRRFSGGWSGRGCSGSLDGLRERLQRAWGILATGVESMGDKGMEQRRWFVIQQSVLGLERRGREYKALFRGLVARYREETVGTLGQLEEELVEEMEAAGRAADCAIDIWAGELHRKILEEDRVRVMLMDKWWDFAERQIRCEVVRKFGLDMSNMDEFLNLGPLGYRDSDPRMARPWTTWISQGFGDVRFAIVIRLAQACIYILF